jgi:hypothetical protein
MSEMVLLGDEAVALGAADAGVGPVVTVIGDTNVKALTVGRQAAAGR